MRVFVFFDLPVVTLENRRNYTKFRKYLIKNGFIMMQESVYCRMALNQNSARIIADNLRRNKPPNGLVQVLCVTEKQFSKMEFITGEFNSDVIDSDERLVIL
ncbi:MAG: CRISPR-associated endonuclease Cas2 [Firmicutes bacterium]|nr:CRISPR-associated endonuclease Cas2 [Bacillota bacterium]